MVDDPQIVFWVPVQIAQLDEVRVIFRNEFRKRGEFVRIVSASGQDEIIEGNVTVVTFHHRNGVTGIS